MPKVGKMKFPYTKKGVEEAISYAKQTGKQVEIEGYRGGGLIPKYQRGGRIPGLRQRLGGARRPMAGPRRGAPMYKKGGKVK